MNTVAATSLAWSRPASAGDAHQSRVSLAAHGGKPRNWPSMSWTGRDVSEATGADGTLALGRVFNAVCTDSRRIEPGCLFIALRGPRHDAHDFAAGAIERGAGAVLVERIPAGVDATRVLRVADTLRALGDLAAWTRRRWGGTVVALTGSNGKTTTKEMLASICAGAYGGAVCKTQGNLNNLIGLPLTILGLGGDERAAVLEMGMNAPGEIARMTEIAAPDVGVITNVGPAHLEGLGSIEGVAKAKGELFAGMQRDATIAVNMDDPWVARLAADFPGRRIEFGEGREVTARDALDRGWDEIAFRLEVGGRAAAVRLAMAGLHNVQNALAAAAAAHALGLDLDVIVAGLEAAVAPAMRMEVVRLANGVTVVNDAYNANPASTLAALRAVAHMPGRAIAVLGEMRELGAASAALHRDIGRAAAEIGFAVLLAVGSEAEHTAAGARAAGGMMEIHVCPDAATAAETVAVLWRPGDAILVKGSRGPDTEEGVRRYGARMVEVVRRLEEKGGLP
jgi:UDP-N-acetylmuramoyl-tripeptide--D-alanyl-D-alanine ligase